MNYTSNNSIYFSVQPASFPDNVTILLEKSGNWANVNQIKVGDKIPMKLTINVPEGTTDIKV